MKTTNNAVLNKIMANKANKEQNKVESIEVLRQQGDQDTLAAVYNGTIALEQLLNITDKTIDMTKCENPITVMQKIYSAGSKVGQVTIQGQNMYMIDVTDEAGFKAFKNGLKELKDQDKHTPYESVWIEGYNMFKQFNFATGQFYMYYVVTNEEMYMLKERIANMSKDKMTVEDAKALQADLPPFVRAWQESSIDVSKDKDKVFKVAMEDILGKTETLSQLTKKFRDNIDFGFDVVKKAKQQGKVLPEFKYANAVVDAAAPVVDLMGRVNIALQETTVEVLNDDMKTLYAQATNKAYEQFLEDTKICKELAYFIKGIYRLCYASRTEGKKIAKEEFALYRNIIYTTAAVYEVAAEDVIRIAIATAMTTVFKDKDNNIIAKDADVNKFKQYPVANIFPDEYVYVMTNETPVYDTFIPEEVIFEMNRDIEDYEEITFVNGLSEDGMIELFDAEFNGTLVELDGKFIHVKDIYAYEETNALLSERTFKEGATTNELVRLKAGDMAACDNGEFFDSILNDQTLTEATVTGANANLLKAAHNDTNAFVCQFIANCDVAKGQVLDIKNVRTYKPANGTQQTFLIVLA